MRHRLIGRPVHLVPDARDGSTERAAVIADYWDTPGGLLANLSVLTPSGHAYQMRAVLHSTGKEPITWHLPEE